MGCEVWGEIISTQYDADSCIFIGGTVELLFNTQSIFDIQTVNITGNQVVMAGESRRCQDSNRCNMFEVDCKQAARAVEVHPLIKRASIVAAAGRVTIKVVEREPWGIVPVDSDFLVIDDCGVCLDRFHP